MDRDGAVAVLIGTCSADTPQDAVDEMRVILGSMTFGEQVERAATAAARGRD